MARILVGLVLVGLAAGLWPAAADDPPKKLTADERKELETKFDQHYKNGKRFLELGKYPESQKPCQDAVDTARKLYPKVVFPNGHYKLAVSLSNLGSSFRGQGKLADAEPLFRESLEMNRGLFKGDHPELATSLNNLAVLLYYQGKLAESESLYRQALEMYRRLFQGDHELVATSLSNLAATLDARGKWSEAERLTRDALAMSGRLFKGDHPDLAISLNNLASLLERQGKLAEAEPLYSEALKMSRRLFKGDHPELAISLNNMALLLKAQGKLDEAEPLCREALEMYKRMFKGDHSSTASGLNNLAGLLLAQEKPAEAESLYREALAMYQRRIKGDHPEVASTTSNLAAALYAQGVMADSKAVITGTWSTRAAALYARGKLAQAEPHYRAALAMRKRLFRDDHWDLARSLNNLAGLLAARGNHTEAESLSREAMGMHRRLVQAFSAQKTEGEALTLLASTPATRNVFLSAARALDSDPATVYPEIWAGKALVARVYEQRQQAARAAATDPKTARMLAELSDTRRSRAELILAPAVRDPATREKRKEDVKEFDQKIADLDKRIRPLLPAIERAERLARATPADLQKALPPDAAVVDFLRYLSVGYDQAEPGQAEKRAERYLAFVVTRGRVAWVDLGPAEPIETAVNLWREAITEGKEIPVAAPAKVRELVWDKVRKELPAGVKTVYIAPDMALARVPWAALPGDKPGTILLEEFAVATIPHGTFLLDQLWPQDERQNPPAGVLVVGGVDYQAEPASGQPANRDLPAKPDAKGWPALPGAAAEATGVAGAAARKKFDVTPLEAEKATASAVLAGLPKARYAHFATHGFFADQSFRSVFQLDPKQFEMTRRGERVGAAALSPLVMTGLVLAGANHPKTPGRGIVTGESLIDLDLSGLELAVLSACETGLGDVAGGEGTFGLQRAFHLAGAKNVVASLWKVPDRPTAALMALFYRNLWEKEMTPVEALRQAQLEVYRNPEKIAALAEGFRGPFKEVPGAAEAEVKPTADGKAHPLLWAAFTLSGPGR